MNSNPNEEMRDKSPPLPVDEDEHFLDRHFVKGGVVTPEDTMKPMVAHLEPKDLSAEKIFHSLEPHGSMAKTLLQTEMAHENELLGNMNLSDAGGEEDQ